MVIKENGYKKVCDMGACRNIAAYRVDFEGLTNNCSLDICRECLIKLHKETKRVIYDKKDK